MHDARGVDVGERAEELASERAHVEPAAAPSGDSLGVRDAADQLHDQIRALGLGAVVVDPDQARMVQPGRHSRLSLEAAPVVRIPGEDVGEDLHRHVATEALVTRHPHDRHPPAAQSPQQPVATAEDSVAAGGLVAPH
jgi:hypothetical protein